MVSIVVGSKKGDTELIVRRGGVRVGVLRKEGESKALSKGLRYDRS